MKLVIFGPTISSSWGNVHSTIWRRLCRALSRAALREGRMVIAGAQYPSTIRWPSNVLRSDHLPPARHALSTASRVYLESHPSFDDSCRLFA